MERALNPYRWGLLALAVLYYTMGFAVRFAWPPLIPEAAADLGIGMSAAGSYMSAFYLGYVAAQIPGGFLGDRFGARRVIGASLLLEAAGTLALGLSPGFGPGFAARLLAGLAAGAVYSSCVRYVASLFPAREQPLAFSLMMMAPAGVGVIIPNALMPWLGGLLAWRGAFCALAALVFLMGLAALAAVRDVPQPPRPGESFLTGLREVMRNRNLMLLSASCFGLMWLMVGFVTWGNTYMKELGLASESGLVMILYGVAGMVACPLAGVLAGRLPSPKYLILGACLGLVPCVLLFGQFSSFPPLAVLGTLIGFLIGLANPAIPLLTARYARKDMVATAGGVTAGLYQCGAILGPLVIGWSNDLTGGFGPAWLLLALGGLLGLAALVPLRDLNNN